MGRQEDIKNKQFACFLRSHYQVKSRRVAGLGNPVGGWEGDGRQGGMDRFLHRPTERTSGLTKIEIGQGDGGIWGAEGGQQVNCATL